MATTDHPNVSRWLFMAFYFVNLNLIKECELNDKKCKLAGDGRRKGSFLGETEGFSQRSCLQAKLTWIDTLNL